MASGHMNRVKRPDTWLHRPMLQNVKKVLANPEPSTHDPNVWSGRALQVDFAELAVSGLASMYPAFDWSICSAGHHGYQRACDLINGQASTGHSGHQCSHAPGRPNLHLVSSSRRPRQVNRIIWLGHGGLLVFRSL